MHPMAGEPFSLDCVDIYQVSPFVSGTQLLNVVVGVVSFLMNWMLRWQVMSAWQGAEYDLRCLKSICDLLL